MEETQTETPPQALTVNEGQPMTYETLPTLDKLWWQRRAAHFIANTGPAFAPRALSLTWAGPYAASLTIISEDGSTTTDAGLIALCEP